MKTNEVVNEPSNLNRSVVIKLEDDGYQGHIEGHNVRNTIHGQYFLKKDNGIQFLSVGIETNDREEKEWGDDIPRLLLSASSYTVNRDTLTMKYDNNSRAMIFTQANEKPKQPNIIYK